MKSRPDWYHELSYREREVAMLLAKGLDNHEISNLMFLAEQTVKNHVSSLYKKIDAKDRTQLIEKLKPLRE
jgi:DNA-binding NarL/FixJ family response regulator